MKSLAERLVWARTKKALSQEDLAKLAGVSQSTIGNLEVGLRKTARKITAIAAALDVDALWLSDGKGAPERKSQEQQGGYAGPERRKFDANVIPVATGSRPVPVISAIQAGALKEISDPYPPGAGFAVEYVDDPDLSRWAFGLEIEGESMLPEFRPGDRVIIDPEMAPNPGDFVAARNTREEATFKKYRPRGMDANGNMVFELVPLNPDYPTMRSDIEHLQVIGVMVEHRKKYRRSK